MTQSSGKIIGIDLGTTNSVVAVMEGGEAKVINNPDGGRTTPSVVAFRDNGERLVGLQAKRQAVTNPTNTLSSIKRFMGRRHNEVGAEEKMVPYKIVGGPDELVKIDVGGKHYTPPEISAMILQYLKDYAEEYLGQKVTQAVITVPAYFNDAQRQATKDAGTIAGLEVKRIINEPTAASLAYGLNKKTNEKIAVFDLGGGTFDISILEVGEGVFQVLSTNGNTHLGGDDFDEALINHIADEFKKEQGIDLRQDQMALQRLKEAAEKAKCELSTSLQTDVNLPFITAVDGNPKHLMLKITRAQFEQLVESLVEKVRQPCLSAIQDAKLKPSEIDEVVLVGGSIRIPAVQELVKQIFGKEPNKSVNPDEVVALGAAIQGGILSGDTELRDVLLIDVTPLSLGIETLGSVMTPLIERNSSIPTSHSEVFSTAADNQPAVDIHVLQGERSMAADNRTLGRFQLSDIPAAPRGVPQVEVTFDIDADGILKVSAKDKGTGKEQTIEIKSSSGLSKEEVEQMKRDAEAHAGEDEAKKELVEARNQADHIVWQTEKHLKEHGENLPEEDRTKIEACIEKVKAVKDSDDLSAIRGALEEMEQASHQMAQAIYAKAAEGQEAPEGAEGGEPGPTPEPAGATAGTAGGDEVIDAEFEVKED